MSSLSVSSVLISQIVGIVFFIVAGLTPIAIVVFATLAYLGSPPPRAAVVLRCIFALALWFIVTLTLILVFFMIVFGAFESLPSDGANRLVNRWMPIFLTGYLAICGLLTWWASWKRRVTAGTGGTSSL